MRRGERDSQREEAKDEEIGHSSVKHRSPLLTHLKPASATAMAEHRVPLALLLLVVGAAVTLAKPVEMDDEYGDGGGDEDEYPVGDVEAPDLVSSPATVRVPLGRRMKLTCQADSELKYHQIIWKKPSGDGNNPKVLSVGNTVVEQDRRLRTRTVGGNMAVELTIDSVEEGDAGVYECSVSTQPPKSVDFTVTVGGEGTEQEVIVSDGAAVGQAEGVDGGGAAGVHAQAGLLLLALGVAVAHAFRL